MTQTSVSLETSLSHKSKGAARYFYAPFRTFSIRSISGNVNQLGHDAKRPAVFRTSHRVMRRTPRWERIEVRVYTSRLLEQIPTTLLATPCEEIVPIGETYEICRSMVGVSSTSSSAIQRIHRW